MCGRPHNDTEQYLHQQWRVLRAPEPARSTALPSGMSVQLGLAQSTDYPDAAQQNDRIYHQRLLLRPDNFS